MNTSLTTMIITTTLILSGCNNSEFSGSSKRKDSTPPKSIEIPTPPANQTTNTPVDPTNSTTPGSETPVQDLPQTPATPGVVPSNIPSTIAPPAEPLPWITETHTMPATPHVDIVWAISANPTMDAIREQFDQGIDDFSAKFLELAPNPSQRNFATEIAYSMGITVLNQWTNQLFPSFADPFTATCDQEQDGEISLLYRGSNGTFVNDPSTLSSTSYRQNPARFRFLFTGDTSGFGCSNWDDCLSLRGTTNALSLGVISDSDFLPRPAKLLPGLDFAHIKTGFCQNNFSRTMPIALLTWQTLTFGTMTHSTYRDSTFPLHEWKMFPNKKLLERPEDKTKWTVYIVIADEDDRTNRPWTSIGTINDAAGSSYLGSMAGSLTEVGRDPLRLRIHSVAPNDAQRLKDMSARTNAKHHDIDTPFGQTLGHLGDDIVFETNSIPLKTGVLLRDGSYQVTVSYNGVEKLEGTDWIFDASSNSIRFMKKDANGLQPLNRPAPGTIVTIRF